MSCRGENAKLLQVGEMYLNHYIRAFRSSKGSVSTPSHHASRPSFDSLADTIKALLKEAPQNHASAKSKALVRDKFRCMISGIYDITSAEMNEELTSKARYEGARFNYTECAHISSESTNRNIQDPQKADYAASVFSIFKTFGYPTILDELNGDKVHRLQNVLTLEVGVHRHSDALKIWLTATVCVHAS